MGVPAVLPHLIPSRWETRPVLPPRANQPASLIPKGFSGRGASWTAVLLRRLGRPAQSAAAAAHSKACGARAPAWSGVGVLTAPRWNRRDALELAHTSPRRAGDSVVPFATAWPYARNGRLRFPTPPPHWRDGHVVFCGWLPRRWGGHLVFLDMTPSGSGLHGRICDPTSPCQGKSCPIFKCHSTRVSRPSRILKLAPTRVGKGGPGAGCSTLLRACRSERPSSRPDGGTLEVANGSAAVGRLIPGENGGL
jgi:hypothetical protein